MTEKDFLGLVLQAGGEGCKNYVSAVQTGAQWEVYAQVLISQALQQYFGVTGREVKYPGSKESADIAFQHGDAYHYVELKVESATEVGKFASLSLKKAIEGDTDKLRRLDASGFALPVKKWMLVMAYSTIGKAALKGSAPAAIDEEDPLCVAIFKP